MNSNEPIKTASNFQFKLTSESAKNFVAAPKKRGGKPGFWGFARSVSTLIKLKRQEPAKSQVIQATLDELDIAVEDALDRLKPIFVKLEQIFRQDTQIDYTTITLSSPEPYEANFNSELTKRALRVLLAYDKISVRLYLLAKSGGLSSKDRALYQKEARSIFASLLELQVKKTDALLK